jgi:lipopolysaccharide exporter
MSAADDRAEHEPGTEHDDHEARHRELDHKIVRSSAWVAASWGGRQVVSFVSTLVLVRLVDPEAFGLIALAWTVLFILESIQESGVGAALVFRRTDVEHAAANTMVWAPIMGLFLFAACFAAAPLVGMVFHSDDLTNVVRVLSVLLIIRGLGVAPGAILEREVDFRTRTKSDIAAAFVQAGVSIGLAVLGAGVWSLVGGTIAGSLVSVLVLWAFLPWRPNPRLANWRVLKEMLRYGRHVGATNILVFLNNTIDNITIGRLLTPALLGFYAVGFRLAELPVLVVGTIVGRVMFPIFARLQDDLAAFRRAYLQNLQRLALLGLPILVALGVATEPIVRGVLGEEWGPTVNPLRLLAIYSIFRLFGGPTGELLKGAGRPKVNVWLQVATLVLVLPPLLVLVPSHGLMGAAGAMLFGSAITGVAALVISMRVVDLGFRELGRALAPPLLCCVALVASLIAVEPAAMSMSPIAGLLLVIGVALVVYVGTTALFARGVVVPIWVAWRGIR